MTDIAGERSRLAAQGLDIVYREAWGSRYSYTSDRAVQRPASYLFLHITVTKAPVSTLASEAAACRQVEAIGQDRFGIGWSYNGGVMQSGRLYEGQPLTRRGAHTVNDEGNPNFPSGSLNEEARALALVQNVDDAVTDAQIDSAARWGAALIRSGEARPTAKWFGHRDVSPKSCPGPIGYARLPELQRLTDHYVIHGITEDDMPTPAELWDHPIQSKVDGNMRPARDVVAFGQAQAQSADEKVDALTKRVKALEDSLAAKVWEHELWDGVTEDGELPAGRLISGIHFHVSTPDVPEG